MSHKPKVAKLDGLAKLPHLTVVDSKSIVVAFRHICDQDHDFLIHTNEVLILNHFL